MNIAASHSLRRGACRHHRKRRSESLPTNNCGSTITVGIEPTNEEWIAALRADEFLTG